MKVLVVCKTTSLDLFGEYVRKKITAGHLLESHLSEMQKGHKEHLMTLDILHQTLNDLDISYRDVSHGQYWPALEKYDAVIALGGDGTVLDASHHIDNGGTPILGIRSSPGSVGQLCSCDRSQISEVLSQLKDGKLKVKSVSRLQATIKSLSSSREVKTSPILNDFLFCNENPAATTHYSISLDGAVEQQKSSGVWLSTAAGSSAAMLSAGGELMALSRQDFQFRVRELYREPDTDPKIVGDFFDPDKQAFEVENLCDSAILAVDGHHNSFYLGYGDRIVFSRAPSLSMVMS